MRPGLLPAICLVGLMTAQPSTAGNLDRCDLARISVHNSIMNTYSELASALARMKAATTDPTHEPYTGSTGGPRFVDMTALERALDTQKATDMGQADKAVTRACDGSEDELEAAVRAALASARRDISAVLSKYLTGSDLSRLLPRS